MDNKKNLVSKLEQKSREIRYKTICLAYEAGESRKVHPGPSLSIIDILVDLYSYKMKIKPKDPLWAARDKFI